MRFASSSFFGVAALGGVLAACSVASMPGSAEGTSQPDAGGETTATTKTTSAPAGSFECKSDGGVVIKEVDWHDFASCECKVGGKARCVPSAQLPPGGAQGKLASCDNGGRCVPDTVLETRKLITCHSSKSILGFQIGDGRCVSMCVPDVQKNLDKLDRGDGNTCAEDERCAPCNHPIDGPTGLCEADLSWKPPPTPVVPADACKPDSGSPSPTTPAPATATGNCCEGKGSCVARDTLDSTTRGSLQRATCASTERCMPLEAAPPPCTDDGEAGVCLDACMIDDYFDRGTCAAGKLCVLCNHFDSKLNIPGCR